MTGRTGITGAGRLETRIVVATIAIELALLAIVGAARFRWQANARFDITANSRTALTIIRAVGLNRTTTTIVQFAIAAATGLIRRAVDSLPISLTGCAAPRTTELVALAVVIGEAGHAVGAEHTAFAIVRVVDGIGIATIGGRRAALWVHDVRCETGRRAELAGANQIIAAVGIVSAIASFRETALAFETTRKLPTAAAAITGLTSTHATGAGQSIAVERAAFAVL